MFTPNQNQFNFTVSQVRSKNPSNLMSKSVQLRCWQDLYEVGWILTFNVY